MKTKNNKNRNLDQFGRSVIKHLGFRHKKFKRHNFKNILELKKAFKRFENPETFEDCLVVMSLIL